MVVGIFGAHRIGQVGARPGAGEPRAVEIVSVDAMQVYAGVETLTNQPSAAERAEVPHHLVGYLPLTAASSVGAHAPLAHAAIDPVGRARCAAAGRRRHGPLPARGAGRALAAARGAGRRAGPLGAPLRRARSRAAFAELGGATHARRGDCTRTTAAASCGRWSSPSGGEPRARARPPVGRRHAPGGRCRRRLLAAGRAARAHRCAYRPHPVGGAVEEVRALRDGGVEPSPTAARILGLAAIGAISRRATLADVAAEITLRTGQYARRQETWARRIPGSSSSQAPTARSATPTACWS